MNGKRVRSGIWCSKAFFRRVLVSCVAPVLLVAALPGGPAQAASPDNKISPLGINLGGINYWSAQMPFLNVFVSNSEWLTQDGKDWDTGEQKYLHVDANGWPMTLTSVNEPTPQKFNAVAVLMLRGLPETENGRYPAGKYIVSYQGEGTIDYDFDAKLVSRAPGEDIIEIKKPTDAGILLKIVRTDPNRNGNYIRNIQVVLAANASAVSAGQIFNPVFLNSLKNFRVLRFMDWLMTNGSTLSSWTNRPLPSNAFWGTRGGVPLEVAVKLANAVSADPWLNIPAMADKNYIEQMASLVHAQLSVTQKVYVEFSNEVWNSAFSQAAYATTQGHAAFPAGLGTAFEYNRSWYGMSVAQMCDTWKSVWGADSKRVVCVMAAQAANAWTATEALSCPLWAGGKPCSAHGIDAIAVAPYFGGPVPSSWTSHSDEGVDNVIASLTSQNDPMIPAGGWLAQASAWESAFIGAVASYKLPVIAYEGGQTFVAPVGDDKHFVDLYAAVNRDRRMGDAYATYLQQWKANGGGLFVVFQDQSGYTKYGEWGAVESVMQTLNPLSRTPPKWQALQNFIAANPCWWSGCTEAVSKVPTAPTSLSIH